MDAVNNFLNGGENSSSESRQQNDRQDLNANNGSTSSGNQQGDLQSSTDNSRGGFMDKLNSMAGGGKESEKNEDYLDKGIDFVQEKFMGQGDQSNESAMEQAKDEQISDFIRDKYKSTAGSDFPIADKDKDYGN